jgi:hypothetical protein
MKKTDETAVEYLRRAIHEVSYEREYLLEKLPTTESVLEFFELWDLYNTEFLDGCLASVAAGRDAYPLLRFNRKYKLGWGPDIKSALAEYRHLQDEIRTEKAH